MDSLKIRKNPAFSAMLAAAGAGFLTHSFVLLGVIHNFDDIASQPGGYGMGLSLGRWLLEILGRGLEKLGLNYNLPFINGLVFLVWLALAAGLLADALHLRQRLSAALAGALLAVFPTASATLFYRYTAPIYGLGIFLAVLGAWILPRKQIGGVLGCALCVACAMGIYQAYAPLTIALLVLVLLQETLGGKTKPKTILSHGLRDCAALLLGAGLYFAVLLAMLALTGTALNSRGTDTMGEFTLAQIPALIWQAFSSFFRIGYSDYCGVSVRKSIQMLYLALMAVSVVLAAFLAVRNIRCIGNGILAIVLGIVFPIAINFAVIMFPGNWIYTLMVYSFAAVGCAPLALLECADPPEKRPVKALRFSASLIVAALVLCYSYYDHVNYMALYYANRQVENYAESLVTQVRMTEGFTPDKKWAFLGNIEDPLLNSGWSEETTYGGSGNAAYLLNQYSRNGWIENYIGYQIPMADDARARQLWQSPEVEAMPCWPSAGSIRVIEDTVVIKCQEYS